MKRIKLSMVTLVVFFVLFTLYGNKVILAQGVGINTTGAVAHASSILDVSSTDKGVLVPRMTQALRDNILAPVPEGLLIYQTDNTPGFYYYDGTVWVRFGSGMGTVTTVNTGVGLTGGPISTTGTINLNNTTVVAGSYGNSSQVATFTVDAQGRLTAAANVAIDGSGHTHAAHSAGTGLSGTAYDGSAAQTWTVNFGATAGTVSEGNHTHTQLHDRQHAITSAADHTASNWQVFYSNGSGNVVELPLGSDGDVLQSTGTASAPVWSSSPAAITTPATAKNSLIVINDGTIVHRNQTNKGVIMTDDTNNCWLLKVETTGALKTQAIACP